MDLLRPNSLDAWPRRAARALLSATLAVLLCAAFFALTAAQSGGPTAYQIKAAFLFNFIKFVEWPETPLADTRAPFVLGVLGDDPFGASLSLIVDGQFVRGRGITIHKYRSGEDVRRCHVLFVSASERAHTAQILSGLQGASVLTVGDMPGFAGGGGIVQFFMEEDRVRFVVNVEAAARANLRVSAKLLTVAYVINDDRRVR